MRTTWQEVQGRYPFAVRAVCLLPHHIHCIWRLPEQDDNFSKRWMSIKAIFTKRFLAAGGSEGRRNQSRKRTGEAAVWQRRFWQHMIRDEDDFRRHFDYIHYNPVQHGYVNRPHDLEMVELSSLSKTGILSERLGLCRTTFFWEWRFWRISEVPQYGGVRPHPCILLLVYFITTSFLLSESMKVNWAVSRSSHPRVLGARM